MAAMSNDNDNDIEFITEFMIVQNCFFSFIMEAIYNIVSSGCCDYCWHQ